jgi:hypothetical protein
MLPTKGRLQLEPWQEALKLIGKCPLCGTAYNTVEAKLFIKRESANLVHLTCLKCRSAFMAMIVTFGQGLSSVGMITDLNFEDVKKIYKTEPITIDEAIEGHQILQQSNFLNNLKS